MKGSQDGRRREHGAVALMVALAMTALVITAGMVLDFGLARLDRQANKSAADAATMAGLQAVDGGTDQVFTFRGACAALAYLVENHPELKDGGLTGSWTDGDGTSVPDPCTTPPSDVVCSATNLDTWAVYTGTHANPDISVEIKSGYKLSDGGFGEESMTSLASDQSLLGGCDQLAVIVTESRRPGLGSLASTADLTTRIRSVGRVAVAPGETAPALLLLEQSKCEVLTVGSAGSPARIEVAGSGTTPGTIHSDSAASDSGCGTGSNQQVFLGKQDNGIVAYGGTDGSSGMITSVAKDNGTADTIVSDGVSKVYGTTGTYDPATAGFPSGVKGRSEVTRRPVDLRYLNGVKAAVISAYSQWHLTPASPSGYTRVDCPPSAPAALATYMSTLSSMTAASSVYIDCPDNPGVTLNGTIGAGRIYVHGFIKNGNVEMPNATVVYIDNTDSSGNRINTSAITLGNGNAFCVRADECDPADPSDGRCSDSPTLSLASKAQLIIRRGQIDSSGGSSPGLLRLCNTTVILAGGQLGAGTATNPGGCLPATVGTAPTPIPCVGASTSAGTSPVALSGLTDWTAPNAFGNLKAAGYLTDAAKQPLWDGGEDLALWTETYGSGPTYKMAGGGNMHVGGVFMAPNAAPFTITGSGFQDLTNAQFISTSFAVDGGARLLMKVDPDNAITYPILDPFTLVR